MGTQITRLTRLAAAGLSAVLLFATTACAATSPAETEPDNKTSVPAPTGPINVVASLNQWGSLAAELGGDDVEVTSIVNSTNVDAHDFEPKTSDVAKLSKAQIIVANGAGYDSWATKSMTKTTNIVSAASVMGAVEGDNPHLWFSKDARSSMATAITDAYIKALPSKKKAFQKRLKAWQAEGFQVVAATEKSRKLLYDADFRRPTVIVMGAEDTGISKEVLKLCDEQLAIPLIGHIESLNVSAAAAVMLFEVVRQRIGPEN